ncbi:MAG TPA: quinone-dependent dihydroorotate dehydrogenase [Anaerolineaceae bacterium]
MYSILRPLIYLLTPEQAHTGTIALLRLGGAVFPGPQLLRAVFRPKRNGPQVQAFGLTFANPLGMAAGYDKDGLGWRGLATLGFGHIELGTVTPRPQPGNPKPRAFRLVRDKAAINRMGFPNRGAEFMVQRLKGSRPKDLILGMNIGKNKTTPLEEAAADYVFLARTFAPLVDYLAVNVSSPNTPGLRSLQARKSLEEILKPLAEERRDTARRFGKPVPVLVKLAPDLTDAELDDALQVIMDTGMDGVIISNTTLSREGLTDPQAVEVGGMSGAPLRALNTRMVKKVYERTGGNLPIVASGGVMDAAGAQEKLDAGAVLVQLYTGLIFAGPGLVRDILNAGLKLRE